MSVHDLTGRDDVINYGSLIKNYPWIIEKNHNCILSPDSDGFLCGLLMSDLLDWKIKGFYDAKVLILEKGFSAKDCIFLDMEIYRENIRSFGHHMLLNNNRHVPRNWDNFKNCIQPNNLRNYDRANDFYAKYPLGTIHMLLGIIGHKFNINITEDSFPPLFFVDGTYKNLFSYPENVLNWFNYLRANDEKSILNPIFMNDLSLNQIMQQMDNFFKKRNKFKFKNERGDKLFISNKNGEPINIIERDGELILKEDRTNKIKGFIETLSEYTGWSYIDDNWVWNNFDQFIFNKGQLGKKPKTLTILNFNELMEKNPISWAITANNRLEYTLEDKDKLT